MKNYDCVLLPKIIPLKEILESCQTLTEQNPISTNEAAASGMNLNLSSEHFITTLFLSLYTK